MYDFNVAYHAISGFRYFLIFDRYVITWYFIIWPVLEVTNVAKGEYLHCSGCGGNRIRLLLIEITVKFLRFICKFTLLQIFLLLSNFITFPVTFLNHKYFYLTSSVTFVIIDYIKYNLFYTFRYNYFKKDFYFKSPGWSSPLARIIIFTGTIFFNAGRSS
jgi:hypothetical protein